MKTSLQFRVLILICSIHWLGAPLHAQVPQLINYQGRVSVSGTNFNGAGQFEFALVSGTSAATSYWSNDGSSTAGSEPASAVSLTVTNGLYSVLLGDTTLTNMTAIPAGVFSNTDVRLRVWFNDGTHGWQQLAPDQRIGAVGYAMVAANVPNGAITSAQLANGAVGTASIAPGSIGTAQLASGALSAPVSISGTTQTAVTNTSYVATSGSLTTITLPTTANTGDVVQVNGVGAGGWQVVQAGLTWTAQTSGLPASAGWYSVGSSSDGTHLVAVVFGGGIYTSTNSGVNWTVQAAAPSADWVSVGSSSDGTYLVAVVYGGGIYTSTNSGVNWTAQTSGLPASANWYSVASSSDGTHLVAAVNDGQIYTSTNSGVNWTAQAGAPTRNWLSVASSSDGTHLVAVVQNGQIYTSTNSGVNWAAQTIGLPNFGNWHSVTSSSDGTHLVAVAQNGQIYTSTNSGANWTAQTSGLPASANWYSVASSSDGTHLVAVIQGGQIYTSTNSGVNWTAQSGAPSANWLYVASSSDGTHLIAAVVNGQIYTASSTVNGTQGSTEQFQYVGNGVWQPVQTAPGSIGSAQLASNLTLGGTVSAGNIASTGTITSLSFSGDGTAVTNVNAITLNGLGSTSFIINSASSAQTASFDITGSGLLGGNLTVSGTASVQNLTLTGNINLPATSSTSTGVVTIGGTSFLNNYGSNVYIGGAGNFIQINTGNNVGIGISALNSNTSGFFNTAIGNKALTANNTGIQNIAIGYDSLLENTNGGNNIALGYQALWQNTTGTNNIALGYQAGSSQNSSNNIYIGNTGSGGDSNTIKIGQFPGQTSAYIAGISGVTVASGVEVYINPGGQLGTLSSSARFKQNIQSMDNASDVLLSLRPVTFHYKPQYDPLGIPQYGLVAEEVEKVSPALVARDANGKVYTVRYQAVNAMLLNEFLKEHKRVETQEQKIAGQEKLIKALEARLDELDKQMHQVQGRLNGTAAKQP